MEKETIDFKVFFIGFNKTGTSSYYRTLDKHLTNSVAHKPRWADWSFIGDKKNLDRFDVFTDGECPHLPTLDQMYPGSKYVLNTRPLAGWLASRHKSIERSKVTLNWFLTRYIPLGFIQPLINKLFLDNSPKAMRKWVKIRTNFHQFALRFFADRPADLLVINIEDEKASAQLQSFLGLENPPEILHENKEGKGLGSGKMLDLLKVKKDMVDSKEVVDDFLQNYDLHEFKADLLAPGLQEKEVQPINPQPFGKLRFRILRYLVTRRERSFALIVKLLIDQWIRLFRSWKHFEYFVPVQKFGGGSK